MYICKWQQRCKSFTVSNVNRSLFNCTWDLSTRKTMPTSAEKSVCHSNSLNETLQGINHVSGSSTKDFSLCKHSSVVSLENCVYQRNNGTRLEHALEDRAFNYCVGNAFVYGVLNGHCGSHAVDFIQHQLLHEISQVEWRDEEADLDIKDFLKTTCLKIERSYFETIDTLLTEKEVLKVQIEGLQPYEALKRYPQVVQKLNAVTAEIESGATAVIALMFQNKLYVANVGDCRAVLCIVNENHSLLHHQLTVDHNFENEDELLRLSEIGVSDEALHKRNRRHSVTRCLGNYVIKGGYKEFGNLSEAWEEPVIAEPEVIGGIPLDDNCYCLILMSSGLYKTLERATSVHNANEMIVDMLNEELPKQPSLKDAVNAVVNKVSEIHYNAYKNGKTKGLHKRHDLTLLVRKFENAVAVIPSTNNLHTMAATLSSVNTTLEPENVNSDHSENGVSSTSDAEEKIVPYVDFSDFYEAVEEAFQRGEITSDWRRV